MLCSNQNANDFLILSKNKKQHRTLLLLFMKHTLPKRAYNAAGKLWPCAVNASQYSLKSFASQQLMSVSNSIILKCFKNCYCQLRSFKMSTLRETNIGWSRAVQILSPQEKRYSGSRLARYTVKLSEIDANIELAKTTLYRISKGAATASSVISCFGNIACYIWNKVQARNFNNISTLIFYHVSLDYCHDEINPHKFWRCILAV